MMNKDELSSVSGGDWVPSGTETFPNPPRCPRCGCELKMDVIGNKRYCPVCGYTESAQKMPG